MALIMNRIRSVLYDEYYWLATHHTWKDMESNPDMQMPEFDLMYKCMGYGFLFLFLRLAFHCIVALPIANLCGLNPRSRGYLADCFKIAVYGLPSRSRLRKFLDCAWRFSFYLTSFSYALIYLRNKPWFHDFTQCYFQYPEHEISNDVRWHYIVEAGFYWSALCVTLSDMRRKDFYINLVHHTVTLALLWISWTANWVRIGTLILVIHDAADIFLEFGKMARYSTEGEMLTNCIFAVFIIVWTISRLICFPFLIHSALFEAPFIITSKHYPIVPGLLIAMLIILQILHIIWSYMILQIVLNTIKQGRTDDVRSDSEESDCEENKKKKIK